MLLKNLYKTVSFVYKDNHVNAEIVIDKDHEIFKGHFPDNPVMPGVCMIQIIKELTEKALDLTLFMEKSRNIKFMALINPNINSNLKLELTITEEDGKFKVKNITKMDEVLALKFSGTFRVDS